MAKKDSHDEELKRGLDKLAAAGFAGRAPSADVPELTQHFGKAHDTDLAVIFLLGKVASQASLAALREFAQAATNKEIKREIKRALFKLAQKGIESAEPRESEAKPVVFETGSDIEAYMSAVDGGGGRLVWIIKPQPGHGLQVIQAMLHDREGLLRVGGMHLKRKELRSMVDEIKQRHHVSMIAIPWEYADRIVSEAYESAKKRGQSGLENYHELRSILPGGARKEAHHPIYDRLNADEVRAGAWRETSRRLLDEPELRYWFITDDWLQAFLPRLEEAQTSRLVLNPVQKEERFAGIVREAVKQLCGEEYGPAFARRMEDMALYFHETQRPDLARLALAVALQVREGDPGPLDVSFLTGLVQKSFAFFVSQEKAKKEEERDSVLIKV